MLPFFVRFSFENSLKHLGPIAILSFVGQGPYQEQEDRYEQHQSSPFQW